MDNLTFTEYKEFRGTTYYDVYAFSLSEMAGDWAGFKPSLHVDVAHYANGGIKLATTHFGVLLEKDKQGISINWGSKRGATGAGYKYEDPWISLPAKEFAERAVQLMAFW